MSVFGAPQAGMNPWEPGEHGRGLLLADGVVAAWGGELPDHWTAAEMLGRQREDIVASLFIEPDGRVTAALSYGSDADRDVLAVALRRHDARLRLDTTDDWRFG